MFSASAVILCPQHAPLTLLFLIAPSSDLENGGEVSFHRFLLLWEKLFLYKNTTFLYIFINLGKEDHYY